MIPVIVMLLMRRYQKNHPEQFIIFKAKLFYAIRIALLLTIALGVLMISRAQEKNLNYTIKKGGSKVGDMNIKEVRDGKKINLRLQSNIKASFILSFKANAVEEATYDNGLLIYSSVYQKLNGTEKVNKQIKYVDNSYMINDNGDEEKLENVKIYYNLVCIYGHEPLTTTLIYSDKYQRFLAIEKIKEHHYKIRFPDGTANEYWYQDGLCTKVKIDHTLYTAFMELNQ